MNGSEGFTDHEWQAIRQIEPLSKPMPDSPFNRMATNLDLARLGPALFY